MQQTRQASAYLSERFGTPTAAEPLFLMPLIEKHGALWLDDSSDIRTQIVFESYMPEMDLLAIVVRSPFGHFVASMFEKVSGAPQWRLPFWVERRPEALFDDEAAAIIHAKQLLQAASGA